MKKRDIVISVVAIGLVILAGYGLVSSFMYLNWETSIKWHDLGKVTAYQTHDELVWNDNKQYYVHQSWTTANITTMSHGIIHFDSRDKSCPWFIICVPPDVTSWHLNQTLGIEYFNGGYYEAQDP